MTHDAFLQAILETPDDDAPRLVYADWLEEHGEPLGPFIRTQCQLARLADDDPRRWPLENDEARLEAELLPALGGEPRPPWARLPAWARRERWRFDRGLIGRLSTTAAKYADGAAALHKVAPVQHLALRNVPRFLDGPFRRPQLRQLRALELSGNRLGAAGAGAVSESPHLGGLKELNVRRCRLRVAEVTRIANAAALGGVERLRLGGNQLYDAGAEAVLASPLRLRYLELGWTLLGPRGAGALANCPTLERLALANNRLGDEGVRRLAAAEGLTRLTHLDLSGNLARSSALAALLASAALPALTHLDLTGNPIDAELFALSPSAARHGRLHLRLAWLDQPPPAALRDSPLVAACAGLDLEVRSLSAAHVQALVGSASASGLRSLGLGGGALGERELDVLLASPHLTRLEELRLEVSRWSDRMTEALLAAPLAQRLRHLSLRIAWAPKRTHDLIERLAALPALERLTVPPGFLAGEPLALQRATGWRLRLG